MGETAYYLYDGAGIDEQGKPANVVQGYDNSGNLVGERKTIPFNQNHETE